MPVNAIVSEAGLALSVKVMLPVRLPAVVGVNSIPRTQLVAGFSVSPLDRLQEVPDPPSEKFAGALIRPIVNGECAQIHHGDILRGAGRTHLSTGKSKRRRIGDVHLANHGVLGIGDVEIASFIQQYAGGSIQLRAGRRTAVAGVSGRRRAHDGRDHSIADIHFTNYLAGGVGDIDVSSGIHLHAVGVIEFRVDGRPAVAGVAGAAGRARNRRNWLRRSPAQQSLANDVIAAVRNVDVVRRIHRHACRAR